MRTTKNKKMSFYSLNEPFRVYAIYSMVSGQRLRYVPIDFNKICNPRQQTLNNRTKSKSKFKLILVTAR